MDTLSSISPLDGRYQQQIAAISDLTSEKGLITFRLDIEARWLVFLDTVLAGGLGLNHSHKEKLRDLSKNLTTSNFQRVKELEATTNHDVKACEYFLREFLTHLAVPEKVFSFIHFGLTSEDVNNLAYSLMLQRLRDEFMLPAMYTLEEQLIALIQKTRTQPMLAYTHGQPASPTTLGKELAVFLHRLKNQRHFLTSIEIYGKLNGTVGCYHALALAYPSYDWPALCRLFVENELKLCFNPLTTQIESHDGLARFAQAMVLYNTIAIGLCQDIWQYISKKYLGLKKIAGEVGSSTMPHKVNPIHFENAEGNFGLSNSLCSFFASKLPISRLQRDLTDSTVKRSLGTMVGHHLLALYSLRTGLSRLDANPEQMEKDLAASWEVLAEAVQTLLRKNGIKDAYEQLKEFSRGKEVKREDLLTFVQSLPLDSEEREKLLALSPRDYIGLAVALADSVQN